MPDCGLTRVYQDLPDISIVCKNFPSSRPLKNRDWVIMRRHDVSSSGPMLIGQHCNIVILSMEAIRLSAYSTQLRCQAWRQGAPPDKNRPKHCVPTSLADRMLTAVSTRNCPTRSGAMALAKYFKFTFVRRPKENRSGRSVECLHK